MSNTNRSLGSVHNTVSSLLFTSTGKTLLSTGKGEMIRVIKYPVSTSKTNVTSLKPTGEEVLSMDCNLSMQKPLILTSGTKGQLCVYSLGSNNAPLIDVQLPAPPGKNENRDVRSAKFFFIDKFITYTLQNQFHLSKYVVNSPDEEWAAVPRRSMLGEPTFTYTFESAQHISAMNVVNQITSSLILLAGTNKELQVVDVISGSSLWRCEEAHSRAIHHVEVNSAGRFCLLR
ncbi:hypothetical protein AGDE_14327 [Angomonas deanei]|uniref:WD domain, G-beta repeat n=1 Tax=Angomonas deanei TaxID=59799 RepID=A0A7G2CFF3_9TRYP|nr:hypothetical protein AGDE_14327 [Angomonas deanei]CAD2218065.1 hypothetical protein, conserved [Angomonas deanei]|eukprot:EPY21036.1 hypothetical protein AGDE_14327 [Angomonas deanei]